VEEIIELRWRCGDCGADDILGRHKRCPTCGSPREKGEMKMEGLDSAAPAVQEAELLELARAGADWFCRGCDSGNRGDAPACASCGAPREGQAAPPSPSAADEARRARLTAQAEELAANAVGTISAPVKMAAAGISALFALLCGGGLWLHSSSVVEARVQEMSWSRSITAQRWEPTQVRAWQHEVRERPERPPVQGAGEEAGWALLGGCREEHHSDERYQCGTTRECEDKYKTVQESYSCSKTERYKCGRDCKDNGNGFATCKDKMCSRSVSDTCTRSKRVKDGQTCKDVPKYCTRPILRTRCDYQTQQWVDQTPVEMLGGGRSLAWPAVPSADELRHLYSATYVVTVAWEEDGEPRQHLLRSEVSRSSREKAEAAAEPYLRWSEGQDVPLEVRNSGEVVGVAAEPAP
jgi:hypothetical protein